MIEQGGRERTANSIGSVEQDTVLVRTKEATGRVLDWLVACAARLDPKINDSGEVVIDSLLFPRFVARELITGQDCVFAPSQEWANAGPFISLLKLQVSCCVDSDEWTAMHHSTMTFRRGPTAEEAISRCVVGLKLGEVARVPSCLLN